MISSYIFGDGRFYKSIHPGVRPLKTGERFRVSTQSVWHFKPESDRRSRSTMFDSAVGALMVRGAKVNKLT